MANGEQNDQVRLADYWQSLAGCSGVQATPVGPALNKARVVEDGSCFFTATVLLQESIEVLLMAQDALAARMLDCAEHYLVCAEATDDRSTYGRIGQDDFGRAQRLKRLILVRWLRGGLGCTRAEERDGEKGAMVWTDILT